ncbi:uncharacterized protein ccdc142 isoform X2 [Pristis pectinata]|uniref:uncharacterized protein ccdc142 isoform X2 n=1 Tax=Pristis pectinata TaxID=685728 RepID=UPI00223E57AB|nr:uncharacterized protein ccdc142 isoform X2 [Pristis pectinata]
MSQTSGGFLLPLGPLLGQKRVSPAEAECKETEGTLESSDESSFPTTLEMSAASSVENKNAIVTEDNKRTYTSFKSLTSRPPKDSPRPDESLQKDKLNHLNGSGPQNIFAKSLLQAETLLWNRLQPGWRWLMAKHQAEDICSEADSDDRLLASDLDSRCSSGRMFEAEQIVFELGKCCHLQQSLKGTLFHGHMKSLPMDILGTTDFQYHQVISSLGNNYAKLRKLLEHRSCILLNEAYVKNLRGASNFIRKLEQLLMQEQEKSKNVNVDISHSNATSLKELRQLCEELRCHTSHWKCLEEKIKNDPWLNCKLLHLKKFFIRMKKTLTLLSINAAFLMEQYISKVLCTLAYADPYSIPSESLWEFFRGLEIYNIIVSESKIPQPYFELNNSIEETNINESDLLCQRLKGTLCKQSGNWEIEPFLIERVLKVLANERGRIAAGCFYDTIMMNKTFLLAVSHHNLTALDWENIKLSFLRFASSRDIFCGEEDTLCQPKLGSSQQELKPCSCKKSIQNFCMEDEMFLNKIVDGLVATNILWQHILNRPKKDKRQETKAEDLQLQHTIFSTENNPHQSLKTKQNDEITGNPLVSPLMSKSVHRQDYTHCEEKVLLFSKYKAILWKTFATHLSNHFYFQPLFASGGSKHNIGKLDQCKAEISALLIQVLHEACYKGLLPSDSEPFVKDLCLSMWSRIALIHWDQVFCSTLGSTLKDKCFPDPESKGDTQRSRTAGLFLALFHPLCITLTWLNLEQAQNQGSSNGAVCKLVVPSILVRTLSHCITTLQASSHWLMTKGFQFLSSWSMNQFLLLIQGDLKVLKVMASKMLQLAETFCVEENHSQGIQESLLQAEVTTLTFSVKALAIFSTKCRKMTLEIFQQTMPVGRQWRVNYRSVVLPSKSNEYATAAVHAVIARVLEGIHQLPEDAQIIPLTEALTAFMEAWMDHILKEKIKFSLQGALQLKQDFDAIRELICSDDQRISMEVRQAVLSLRVFHQVDNAIICLLQQPTRKVYVPSNTWDQFRRCCSSSSRTVDFSHQNLNSLDSLDLRSERTRAVFRPEASDQLSKIITTGHPESYLVVNQQEWLALRVNSNRRRKVLRLPCMKNTPEQ